MFVAMDQQDVLTKRETVFNRSGTSPSVLGKRKIHPNYLG
jgi:hypothetical protein